SLGLVVVLLLGLAQGVLLNALTSGMNDIYSVSDKGTSGWISQPTSELRSGGTGSLLEWDTLGSKGRDFVGDGGGPTATEIEAFTGRPALEPIRVYVGLRSAPDVDDRVDLAIAELERTGAFERDHLVVNTTTGTGWVDENVVDSFEFMHGGDTAQVAMQYSYLPSWVSFLVDRSKAEEAGEKMITAVVDRVDSLPEDRRPTLYAFGESLGSFGTEAAFTSPENMLSNIDGALLVGPTFVNPLHEELVSERDSGSPAWRPVVDDGAAFRFAVEPDDLDDPSIYTSPGRGDGPRVVYLQNSSDPITYFNPDLILGEPEWLQGEKGPDVSDDMAYIPVVTFFQIAADMAFAMDVPDGHGHRYGSNVVDGWAEVSRPDGWTDDDTLALRELIDQRAEERSARKAAAG
ncbi:alpha/beta hydrolase, partial [Ilumatobacter sp.]|uniref:alpha/beta hydrolase n=1 Tax=Ilumatobacter sp. TaxID=1967498 RepID=UPI003AF9FA22